MTVGLDKIMNLYEEEARIVAEETFNVHLDGSRKSLSLLDWVVAKQYDDEPKGLLARLRRHRMDHPTAEHFARMWCGYAGGVMHQFSAVTWGLGHDYRNGRCLVILIAGEEMVPVVDSTLERMRKGHGETFAELLVRVIKEAPLPEKPE